MDEHNQKRTGDLEPADTMPWVRPELSRFRAGAAELGDVSSADGSGQFS